MTTFLPHYTPADIQAVKDISVWAAATCRSTQALATMIGGGNGTLSKVLRGGYTSSPSPILARVLRAAGQRLPDGWEALLPAVPAPAPEPEPCVLPAQGTQARPAMTAWEPGATLASVAAERRQILKALAKHSSQAPLQRDALLKRLGDTPEVRLALEALVQTRDVMDAVVTTGGERHVVLYIPGRVPVERPGPKVGNRKRGKAISIPPSTRAGSGQGSRP